MRFYQIFSFGLITALMLYTHAGAAELVVFDSPACSYCEQCEDEIAETYPKTEEGKKPTLRRVFIHDYMPTDLRKLKPIICANFCFGSSGAGIGVYTWLCGGRFILRFS